MSKFVLVRDEQKIKSGRAIHYLYPKLLALLRLCQIYHIIIISML